jgi:drug/metabolite transporter (DMT)-like permease
MPIPVAYLSIILIWSTTPLAIQWSALGAGFAFAVTARMAIGLTLAVLILLLWRLGFPRHREALATYAAGGLGLFGAMTLTYWGAQYVHSGLVALVFGTVPLVTSLMAALWLNERALTAPRVAGMLIGLVGLAVVFSTADGLGSDRVWLGLLALLLAVLCYSAGLVWVKRIGDDSPPLAITAGTMTVALPLFLLVWLVTDGGWPDQLSGRAAAAILYLGVCGSVLGFALYFYVVQHLDTGPVSLISLINPVIALMLGSLVNGEVLPGRVWAGAAAVILGLAIYQWETLAGLPRAWFPAAKSSI